MKLSDFNTTELEVPTQFVTVREFAKVLGVPDQMIHQYTTKGTIECNREYGQKRVDLAAESTLTWLVKYVSKRPELKEPVTSFLMEHIEIENDES